MDINFIKSSPAPTHRKIKGWLFITGLATTATCLVCGIIFFMQFSSWHALEHEKKNMSLQLAHFDKIITDHKKLSEEETIFKKQLAKINNHLQNKKNPADLLKTIKTFLKDGTLLEHLAYSSESAEIKITATDTKTIMHMSQQLESVSTHKNMKVCSLDYKDAHVTAVLKNDQKV